MLWRLASCFLSESALWKVLQSLFQGCVSDTDRCLLIVDINLHGCPPDSQTPAVLSRKDNPCEDRFSRLLRGDTSLHERLLIQGWLCAWTWRVFLVRIFSNDMSFVCFMGNTLRSIARQLFDYPWFIIDGFSLLKTSIQLGDIPAFWWRISSMTGPTRRASRRYDACAATRTLEVKRGMCGGFGQNQLGWKRAQIHQWLDCMPSRELIDLIANYTPQSDLNANDRL